jgi:hypothetical protein
MPGYTFYAPFNLSSKPVLHLGARGEGDNLRVQLFCDNVGQVPPEQPFEVTSEWQKLTLDLTMFDGYNVEGVLAIIFSAGTMPGEFSFQIDDVSFP